MKQDIREIFKDGELIKRKLPESHREEFLKKIKDADFNKKSRKKRFIGLKVAASIAAVITLILVFQKEKENIIQPTKIVNSPIVPEVDSIIDSKNNIENDFKNNLVAKEHIKNPNIEKFIKEPQKKPLKTVFNNNEVKQELPIIENSTNKILNSVDTLKIASTNNESIKVNSDALLFSITHSKEEILAYYKENELTRESVLKNIEYELTNFNIAINAEDLLIEIESGLTKKSFKEKLLARIKLKIKELSNTIVTN